MEDVIDVYHRPYDPRFPQICMDEGSKQLLLQVTEPIPMEPGKLKREDYEHKREGVYDVFGACEPLTGKYFFKVTETRTKEDWAYFMRDLIDTHYKDTKKDYPGDGQPEHARAGIFLQSFSGGRGEEIGTEARDTLHGQLMEVG